MRAASSQHREEVLTSGSEDEALVDDEEPLASAAGEAPPPSSGAAVHHQWSVVHDPDSPLIEEEVLERPRLARPFSFYVYAPSRGGVQRLSKVTLPRSWVLATVGQLVKLLASRAGLAEWDCHVETPRGALPSELLACAAIVRRERVTLCAGPPPSTYGAASPRARRALWVWGRCVDGTLLAAPRRQPGIGAHQVLKVSLGDEHALALTSNGLVLSWGRNDCGQLGTGGEVSRASPHVVRALSHARFVEIACGPRCSGGIAEDGALWTFGANQPANRPTLFHTSWANAHGRTPCGKAAATLAFGATHAMCLGRDGALWTWGYNESLQLGWEEALTSPVLRIGFQKPRSPVLLGRADEEARADAGEEAGGEEAGGVGAIVAIACGEAHSACLTSKGFLFAWGDNSTGQCGTPSAPVAAGGLSTSVSRPALVPMPHGDGVAATLRTYANTTLVISSTGRAYTFGGGSRGGAGEDDSGSDDDDNDGVADADNDADEQPNERRQPGGEGADAERGARASRAASRGLGRLLGSRKLVAERVADAAGCADHLLLAGVCGTVRGLGYNRYSQACPADGRLQVHEPTALPPAMFAHQRVLSLAVGGGCSVAVSEARETLASCCVAVLRARLEAGDVERCAELLCLASAVSDAPSLAPLAAAAAQCVQRHRAEVVARCAASGLSIDVDAALEGLEEMVGAAAAMQLGGEGRGDTDDLPPL